MWLITFRQHKVELPRESIAGYAQLAVHHVEDGRRPKSIAEPIGLPCYVFVGCDELFLDLVLRIRQITARTE